ncbi:hypothetical protein EJ05DRAFT_443375 [Pseudovirgaria hyperparasitica]|uniref:N1221-domain-containing protein n=1 Tax=Pseudovirgaria hyperparasitica TaxID=470096 RepID=A0A6A6VUW7_9PEZI|nr:uncharacterized protein EJ05DRAFT_443375 [Pseudovirgaria hyperparasitica]KAF2754478.1 hypothetical protein EJ05DRAFT_443375 [Pseudovirgaria hyperparasitica]
MLAIPLTDQNEFSTAGNPNKPGLDTVDQEGLTLEGEKPHLPQDGVALPTRPGLRREKSAPPPAAPQSLPPPAPPASSTDMSQSTDSLSVMQLRRLVGDMPTVEPTPYAFEYKDASTFAAELEEWFSYNVEEHAMILKCQAEFAKQWEAFLGEEHRPAVDIDQGSSNWLNTWKTHRVRFVLKAKDGLRTDDHIVRLSSLEVLTNIALGCWYETAGLSASPDIPEEGTDQDQVDGKGDPGSSFVKSALQIQLIKSNVRTIIDCGCIPLIYDAMRSSCQLASCRDVTASEPSRDRQESDRRELWCCLTLMYIILDFARIEATKQHETSTRSRIRDLEPDLLVCLMEYISRIRWDDTVPLPLPKMLLITWKAILVCFGGLSEVDKAKSSFQDPSVDQEDQHGRPLITASPLDYHLFRQEISSKYPAYNPPPPLFPLEPENNSILPPLKNHPSKAAGSNVFGSAVNVNANGTSILHQPVHIATPAPSPPPSPAGPGGKGGKKQNYQTNQLFPFLYPPLDESSNNLGGKGTTDLQDLLVGRRWDGSDIPASILEAAQLFSTRMRASRSMKQLWQVRVQFMKYERGWLSPGDDFDGDVVPLDLSKEQTKPVKPKATVRRTRANCGSPEERLEAVENFYRDALPQLQSLIIVLIRVILNHVTTLVTQANGANGLQSGFQFQENQNGSAIPKPEMNGALNGTSSDSASVDEIDALRSQEILDKALTGTLVLLLKWFKVSHILKYEYLTQLLVDSSYIPLVLKLLQLQEIERVVNYNSDRDELNFFTFCYSRSRHAEDEAPPGPIEPTEIDDSSEDDAAPPPIKRQRDPDASVINDSPEPMIAKQPMALPEVDELGFPTSELPSEPITTFSWRAFYTSINYLRIMQKICKSKAHRNLMLVSYKSSQVLRKCLRVPQPALRLYTLKLFKNQVPYCGRKWRQSNMRVITAVYLHCRPELRDEWLSGGDVDAEVDESVPLEQALRALTHWWNLRHYPEAMGANEGVLEEERDFFKRELEKMQFGDGLGNGEGGEGQVGSDGQWEGQLEGW